jgi:hypothetical protein
MSLNNLSLKDCSINKQFYKDQFYNCMDTNNKILDNNPQWNDYNKEQKYKKQLNMCCSELGCKNYKDLPFALKCPQNTKTEIIIGPHFFIENFDYNWIGVL